MYARCCQISEQMGIVNTVKKEQAKFNELYAAKGLRCELSHGGLVFKGDSAPTQVRRIQGVTGADVA